MPASPDHSELQRIPPPFHKRASLKSALTRLLLSLSLAGGAVVAKPKTVEANPASTPLSRQEIKKTEENYPYPPEKILRYNPEYNSGWFYYASPADETGQAFWVSAVRTFSTSPTDTTAQLMYGITNVNDGTYVSGNYLQGSFTESADATDLSFVHNGNTLVSFKQDQNDPNAFHLELDIQRNAGHTLRVSRTVHLLNGRLLYESGDGNVPMTPSFDSLYVSAPMQEGDWVDFQKFNPELAAGQASSSLEGSRGANHRWGSFILEEGSGTLPPGTAVVFWEILDTNDQRQEGGFTNIDLLLPSGEQVTRNDFQIVPVSYYKGGKMYLQEFRLIQADLGLDVTIKTVIPNQDNNFSSGAGQFYEGATTVRDQTGVKGRGMLEETHNEKGFVVNLPLVASP